MGPKNNNRSEVHKILDLHDELTNRLIYTNGGTSLVEYIDWGDQQKYIYSVIVCVVSCTGSLFLQYRIPDRL